MYESRLGVMAGAIWYEPLPWAMNAIAVFASLSLAQCDEVKIVDPSQCLQ